MGVESAADRLVFFSAADFGVVARYVPGVGAEASISGIFDKEHLMVEQGEAGVSTTAPVFTCRSDDLAALPMGSARRGDQVIIEGVSHQVIDIQADGTGVAQLVLKVM